MRPLLLSQTIDKINKQESITALESGRILFFPEHFFSSIDRSLMSESILDGTHKNIAYDYVRNKLGGYQKSDTELKSKLESFMRGYAEFAFQLIQSALPAYAPYLQWGRTSFRPAEIKDRALSKRKDDTRLHVDSFPASPVNGLRILRIFCNINPENKSRVWNIGEPFSDVLDRFASKIPAYSLFLAKILKLVKSTKTLRSPYDHYMIHLHDAMKLDDQYQHHVPKTQINFPAQSSWVVFTDSVSHAALSGQYLLEHTFYLPVDIMENPKYSPLSQWNQILEKTTQATA